MEEQTMSLSHRTQTKVGSKARPETWINCLLTGLFQIFKPGVVLLQACSNVGESFIGPMASPRK
jgi:hypothetical protein